jgi:soluble lytic murein transglycosylase
VVAESEARELDPYFVYSLMRQESLFDPRVVSPAAAYGLMQLLLSTARRMATRANIDAVDVEDLFSPETNVKLGTEYLTELADRFDSDPVLMLAGYNAGETAAERWQERGKDLELDEFIEKISYRETRAYVKKVLRNYRNYLRLYGEIGSGTLRPKQR